MRAVVIVTCKKNSHGFKFPSGPQQKKYHFHFSQKLEARRKAEMKKEGKKSF